MSDLTPSEIYYKARRALIVAAGALILVSIGGLEVGSSDSGVTLFALKFTTPDAIPLVFLFVVAYAVWQILTAWYVQASPVKEFVVNRLDLVLTLAIAMSSMTIYLAPIVYPYLEPLISSQSAQWSIIFVSGLVVSKVALRLLGAIKSAHIKRSADEERLVTEALLSGDWVLVFNPTRKVGGAKEIGFNRDGSISTGRNKNEHSWRVIGPFLEILNENDRVFSRFRFSSEEGRFIHTNDEDTLSLRNQRIERRPK